MHQCCYLRVDSEEPRLMSDTHRRDIVTTDTQQEMHTTHIDTKEIDIYDRKQSFIKLSNQPFIQVWKSIS